MRDLHTNEPDPKGYAITYEMNANHEPVALIVTRLADDTEIRDRARSVADRGQ